ncbi:MAG: RNA polymerase factor sigma-54 [Desulfatibacillum sp.]|nr:RNA polymerase factor sigma-54 [Desulfatibacillum sp.]
MALELRQQLRLTQQLIMTPQLQMAIKLLQLSHMELLDVIQQEMEQNAAIEEGDESGGGDDEVPETRRDDPLDLAAKDATPTEEKEVVIEERAPDDMDWSNYMDEYSAPGPAVFESEEREAPKYESFIARKESLSEHLLWQLMLKFSNSSEQKIGEMIIGNLNKDGYLDASIEELAQVTQAEPILVEKVLGQMQTLDPVGVCARNLSECLLIQIRHLQLDNSVVEQIICNHLNHLQNKNYKAIASALHISMDEVLIAVRIIMSLEPKPGRQFSDEEPHYIVPDIFVYKIGDNFEIVLNDDGLPKLHVSNFYKKAMQKDANLPEETKNYVQGKLRSAAWLIRSIHQRQRTIFKVMESIVKFQRPFLDKGIAHLKPMVLRDVAEDIEMHESTISRVTTNKYAHTPQGIFELKYFFNSSINRVNGGSIASASVKERILQIVKSESPLKPFSDDKIAAMLEDNNIQIARRTVAKYREMLGILPSSKRKKLA